MTEEVKRLTPTLETVKELYLKSGNRCAYPGCTSVIMTDEGTFVGQICHIEAASREGQRFNDKMTNEERRHVSNLMLMCYPHHQVTNDVAKYTVAVLQKMKADHEKRITDPGVALWETLTDTTTLDKAKTIKNLRRINRELRWGQADKDLVDQIGWLNGYIENFRTVPRDVRHFLGKVVQRMHLMRNSRKAFSNRVRPKILFTDVRDALKLDQHQVAERVRQLEGYELGGFDEIELPSGSTEIAVNIKGVQGWDFWLEIAEFCSKAPESFEAICDELDFSRLDD